MDEARLAAHALEHHGVFDLAAIISFGGSAALARDRVRAGRWSRLHPRVFIAATTPIRRATLAEAALRSLPGAVLSHETARWVHRLRDDSDDGRNAADGAGDTAEPIDVSLAPDGVNRRAGVRIHQRRFADHHTTRRAGWSVTTVERTLVDLAAVRSVASLRVVVENALLDRRTTAERLGAVALELAAQGRSGTPTMRAVLRSLSEEIPESKLERQFLQLVRTAGLPRPAGQARFDWLHDERCRVDFWYPDAALIVELDGRSFHARAAAFDRDRVRDLAAAANGFTTIRLTATMLRAPETPNLLRSVLGRP